MTPMNEWMDEYIYIYKADQYYFGGREKQSK